MATAVVAQPLAPIIVSFAHSGTVSLPVIPSYPEGSTFGLFSSVHWVAEGPAIMPVFTGGGGTSIPSGYVSFG